MTLRLPPALAGALLSVLAPASAYADATRPSDHDCTRTEPDAPPPPPLCPRPWPDESGRQGVYAYHHIRRPIADRRAFLGHLQSTFLFDGETVTIPVIGWRGLDVYECTYGGYLHFPGRMMMRLHAHLDGDDLYMLMPCRGWVLLGRFLPNGHFLGEDGVVSHRIERGDTQPLEASFHGTRARHEIFMCGPIYEVRGEPLPPRPGSID